MDLQNQGQLGQKLEFNRGELYYTSAVKKTEAERLGTYLVRSGYFDGERKTFQLDGRGRSYQVRCVVKKGIDSDPVFIEVFRMLADEISRNVFDNKAVEIHLCDEYMNTLRVVIPP